MYASPGSSFGQIAGLGAGLAGLFGRAEGGVVNSYADGGVTDVNNVRDIIDKLSDQQLQEAQKAAAARGDQEQLQLIAAEMAQRASMRMGIGAGITDEFADSMEEGMAHGGIVAFAGGGTEYGDPMGTGAGEIANTPRENYGPSGLSKFLQRYSGVPEWKIQAQEDAAKAEAPKAAAPAKAPAPAPAPAPVAKEEEKKPAKKEAPKVKKEVTAAVKEVAANSGVPEKSLTDEAMALYEKMQGMRKPELDKLNALIAQKVGRAEEIKGRGLSDALMNFGFTMASEASKPGARFLGSASRAAPEISKTMGENQKAADAARDAFNKAQIEQLRSEIAGSGENMRTSLTTAQNIMRDRLEEKRLAEQADYNRKHLAVQAAQVGARGPNVYEIARTIMADPSFKGSERDALTEAYAMMNGTAMRADSAARLKYGEAVKKIDEKMAVFLAGAKTPAEKAAVQDQINKQKESAAQAFGITSGGGAVDYSGWGAVKKVGP
jgi:hypothetical protein